MMKEISIKDFEGIDIGQVEDVRAGTGCTAVICKAGMRAGLDVRGGGPASRDSRLLDPLMAAQEIHGILLSGGSAFGLAAAGGAQKYLEEKDIGFDVGVTKVPLVVQSCLFDLTVGDPMVRPDEKMGYEAARTAMEEPNYRDGNYGAGCGATVGKICGMETSMKTGMGSYAVEIDGLKVGAMVALNAMGDIFDWKNGRQIAGLQAEDGKGLRSTSEHMKSRVSAIENRFVENTTLGVIITNGAFDKAQLCKIAGMAHDGYARSIDPVHCTVDGDSIYAVSAGDFDADQDLVGTLAAEVMSEAICRAVYAAESAYGIRAVRDIEV